MKMITGDHLLIARQTAKALDMGSSIYGPDDLPLLDAETKQKPPDLGKTYGDLCLAADGFAQVYPEHKVRVLDEHDCFRFVSLPTAQTILIQLTVLDCGDPP